MKPRSRNVMSGCQVGIFFSFFIFLFAFPVKSAVLSIDLGSEWMKVAVVNLKPGQSPISVAINEMSKRKSPALVAFSNGHRLVGEEASGIAARYPERVYSRVRDMVGKPFEEVKKLLDSQYLPYDIVKDSRGAAAIKIDDGESIYSSEELLATILGYGKNFAEAHAKTSIKDAVITVPPYMGQVERECVLDAARLAGITVLALLNEHSGAALQYGIDKDFSNGSRHVMFYDMGANGAYAALVLYSAYASKEFGKNVTANQFQVKDVRWDGSVGGQTMEMRLVEYFADLFNEQLGSGVDIRQYPKSLAKLKKQVKRTKEILSANIEAPFSVESLYNDLDFRSTITRVKFEELCEDLWEKALGPIKEVLKHTGLTLEDLHAVELIGGATRVPKLQGVLSEFLGRENLDRHLDADEAIALGAALHAANLSDGFKMNRKLGMVDGVSYGIFMKVQSSVSGSSNGEETDFQLVVPRLKKFPSKAFKSLRNSEDFKVSLLYDPAGTLPPGVISTEIATFQISGVTDAHAKYASRNLSAPVKTNLHFSLSRSAVLSLDRAETVIEVSEWVEVPMKKLSSENSTEALNSTTDSQGTNNIKANEEAKGPDDSSVEEGDEQSGGTGAMKDSKATYDSTASDILEEVAEDIKPVLEKKFRKRTIRVPLKIKDVSLGVVRPMSKSALKDAALRIEKLNEQDAEKKRTAEAKNNLEAYIYATKDKLDSSEDIERVSTEEQRDSLRQLLIEAEEWLYTDGEEASAEEFQKRLETVKSTGESIFFRLEELKARPAAVNFFQQYVDGVKETLEGWESSKPWIIQSSKEELLKEAEAVRKWLKEKETKQKETPGHEDPAFTSDEVYGKAAKLQEKVLKLGKTPKPKPQVEKKASGNSSESSTAAFQSNTSEYNSTAKTEDMEVNSGVNDQSTEDIPVPEKDTNSPHDEL